MRVDAGLVFLSDSRTNAGVDHISSFRKMVWWEQPGERVLVMLTSGNLSISQAVINLLNEKIAAAEADSLYAAPDLFEASVRIGAALRAVHARDAAALAASGIDFNAAFIFGGQVKGEAPRLFHIYAAGNFIEATEDTPYFQIGESKYGKPIIDRVINRGTSLAEAAKCALISMDSTIRSNLSVGLPLDLAVIETDALRVADHQNIESNHDYFLTIRNQWGLRLREAFAELPNPDWL
jgi:putative proteasome-type protease